MTILWDEFIKLQTMSKTFQTVKQWVSDVENGRKESYYGWKFSKE